MGLWIMSMKGNQAAVSCRSAKLQIEEYGKYCTEGQIQGLVIKILILFSDSFD